MAGINIEIDALARDMEKASQDLSLLYLELGQKAAPWHKAIAYQPSFLQYERLCKVVLEKEAIDKEIDSVKTALENLSKSDKEIKKTKLSLRSLEARELKIEVALGAVVVEIDRAGKLPNEYTSLMKESREFWTKEQENISKKSSESILTRLVKIRSNSKKSKKIQAIYSKIGISIIQSDCFDKLESPRAKSLIEEYLEIQSMKESFSKKIKKQNSVKNEASSSLEQMGVLGAEVRKLRNLELQNKQVMDKLEARFESYGEVLAGGISDWLDDQAPNELQTSCNLIRDQKRRMTEQKLNMELLQAEKSIEVHQAQTEQLASQLSHLNNQLSLIEKQKTDVQIKIEDEKTAIQALRKKQAEINSQF